MTQAYKVVHTARYENTNNIGIAIIAVITHDSPGHIFDWAAYIGATTDTEYWTDAVEAAKTSGNKLRPSDAAHYFPTLPIERYRE